MRVFYLILALSSLAVSVAGCKRGEPQGQEGGQSPVKVAFHIDWIPGVDYIGYYTAEAKGFYKDEGLDLTILTGNGAPQAAQLIGAGKIKVGTTTGDAIVQAQHGGIPVVAVAVVFPRNPVVLLSVASNPIKELKQLEGKRLGYHETSVTYEQFKAVAKKQNIDMEKIRRIEVSWGGAAELMKGDIDAVLAYATDKPVDLEARGVKYYELPFRDLGMNVVGQCIAVHQKTVARGVPDWLKRFVKASIRGWEHARRNPEEAVELFVKQFADQDKEKCLIGLRKTLELLPDETLGEKGYLAAPKDLWQQTENNVADMIGLKPRDDAARLLFAPIDGE